MTEDSISAQLRGATARWAAAVRAQESAREDCLFKDPWAAALAGQDGAAWLAQRTEDSVLPMVIRTRFFDDFLQRIVIQNGLRQIVLVGAGLDTRAYRLLWPAETQFYELDQPAVLQYKEQVLDAAGAGLGCERRTVGVDLTGAWPEALLELGFDPQRPSAWLLEGVLFYFTESGLTHLLAEVASLAAPGSWQGLDVINSRVLTSPWTAPWVEMQAKAGAPWTGTLDDPAEFLAALGWQVALTQAGAEEANYGRWSLPVIPTMMPDMPHEWLVTAQRE